MKPTDVPLKIQFDGPAETVPRPVLDYCQRNGPGVVGKHNGLNTLIKLCHQCGMDITILIRHRPKALVS